MNFKKTAVEIVEYVKNNRHITSLGLRSLEDDESSEIGAELRESYTWDMEHDCSTYHTTGETLNGTCSTGLEVDARDIDEDSVEELAAAIEKAYAVNKSYGSTVGMVVIGGTCHEYGNDDAEYIIENAEVVAHIQK